METRTCENCGESVDAAKAFCPGCGNAFVEERKRAQQSEFDRHDSTVQMGQTMYNQMLSEMGLNISKPAQKPAAEPKRADVVVPLTPAAPVSVELKPAAPSPAGHGQSAPTRPAAAEPADRQKPGSNKWIWILAAAGVVLFLIAALIVAGAIGFYIYTAR
jgi:hypothetical protein